MADVSFFDPKKEAEVRRKRLLAEQLMKQGEQTPNEVVSGIVVKKSPLEGLAKALQMGVGGYQAGQADKLQTEDTMQKQKALADAVAQYGTDPQAAAQTLMQSPATSDVGMKIYMDDIKRKQDLELAQAGYAREDAQLEKEAALKRELAAMRAGGGALVPELNPETGQFEMVQSNAPRKLSATEQKNFYEQKAKTDSVRNALGVLDQVDEIKKEPRYSGFGSGAMAFANRVPLVGRVIDDTKAANTTSMDNLLKELAYSRLQSTFPGAISNAERESLEKLQALSSYSIPEQEKIIKEARKVLQRQGEISSQMQEGIVSGQVYQDNPLAPVQPQGVQPAAPQNDIRAKLQAAGIPPERIDAYLRAKGQ